MELGLWVKLQEILAKLPVSSSGIDFTPDVMSLSSSVSCTSLISILLLVSLSLQKALTSGSLSVDFSDF